VKGQDDFGKTGGSRAWKRIKAELGSASSQRESSVPAREWEDGSLVGYLRGFFMPWTQHGISSYQHFSSFPPITIEGFLLEACQKILLSY